MKNLKSILIPILICVFFFIFYSNKYKTLPIRYWDEYEITSRTYLIDYFLNKNDDLNIWSNRCSIEIGKFPVFFYGFILRIKFHDEIRRSKGLKNFLEKRGFYCYGDWRLGFKNKFIKPKEESLYADFINKYGQDFKLLAEVIFVIRKVNVILLVINLVIVYYLSLLITQNLIISLLLSFLMGFNNIMITYGLIAQSESLFILLFNLSLLNIFLFLKYRQQKNHINFRILFIILFSITLSLLNQTKINGIMLIFPTLVLLYFFNYKKKEIILYFFIILIIFISINSFLDPYVRKNFFKNFYSSYSKRLEIAKNQAKEFPLDYLPSFADRTKEIFCKFYCKKNISKFNNFLFFKIKKTNYLLILFFLIGFMSSILFYKFKAFILTFLLILLITRTYTILNWDRYYIHLVLFFYFFQLIGVCFLTKTILKFLVTKNSRQNSIIHSSGSQV